MLLLITVIVLYIVENGVNGGDCQTSSNLVESKCYSDWSEWTNCVSPLSNIQDTVADYKQEIRNRGCREPLAFWAATVNSKMMKHRKSLPEYLMKKGLHKQKIVKKRIGGYSLDQKMMTNKSGKAFEKLGKHKHILMKAKGKRYQSLDMNRQLLHRECHRELEHGREEMSQEFYDLMLELGIDMPKTRNKRKQKPMSTMNQTEQLMDPADRTENFHSIENADSMQSDEVWRIMKNTSSEDWTSMAPLQNFTNGSVNQMDILHGVMAVLNILEKALDFDSFNITENVTGFESITGFLNGSWITQLQENYTRFANGMAELQNLSMSAMFQMFQANIMNAGFMESPMRKQLGFCDSIIQILGNSSDRNETMASHGRTVKEDYCDQFFELMAMDYEITTRNGSKQFYPASDLFDSMNKSDNTNITADDVLYEMMDGPDQPSAGCGFCTRRVRCCNDNVFSWIDQEAESEPCVEHSSACDVPPLSDGSCNFAKYMPQFQSEDLSESTKNRKLAEQMENNLRQKWMQYLGALEPTMNCVEKGALCYCCCGNNTPAEDKWGNFICRYDRVQSTMNSSGKISPAPIANLKPTPKKLWFPACDDPSAEEYRPCGNGCDGTCDNPNPVCPEICAEHLKGCYCKPGYVRYGKRCILQAMCPRFVDPIYPNCSNDDVDGWSEWSECTPTGLEGERVLPFEWIEKLRKLNCSVVTPESVQMYFSTVPKDGGVLQRNKRQTTTLSYCGYCSTKLRCCQDTQEWHLQATERQVCTEPQHSVPCEVELNPDVNGCQMNQLFFPDTAEMFQRAVVQNETLKAQIIGKLERSHYPVPDPSFNCIQHSDKCYCCCHEYSPVLNDSSEPECQILRKI